MVDEILLHRIQSHDGFGNFSIDVFHRFQYALAKIALHVAIAQFSGFLGADGCAGRYSRPSQYAGFEQYIRFYSRIAAGIDDFAGDDIYDCTHAIFPRCYLSYV